MKKMSHTTRPNGFVIPAVFGIMLIILIVAITFITVAKLEVKKSTNHLRMLQAKYTAEAGLDHALAVIATDNSAYTSLDNDIFSTFHNTITDSPAASNAIAHTLDSINTYTIIIRDCEGLINANATQGLSLSTLSLPSEPAGTDYLFPEFAVGADNTYFCARSYRDVENLFNLYLLTQNSGNITTLYEALNTSLSYDTTTLSSLAASLVDYFDTTTTPTTMNSSIGLEACPMISEIMTHTRTYSDGISHYPENSGWCIALYNPTTSTLDLSQFGLLLDNTRYTLSGVLASGTTTLFTDSTGRIARLSGTTNSISSEGPPTINNVATVSLVLTKNGNTRVIDTVILDSVNIVLDESWKRYYDPTVFFSDSIWNMELSVMPSPPTWDDMEDEDVLHALQAAYWQPYQNGNGTNPLNSSTILKAIYAKNDYLALHAEDIPSFTNTGDFGIFSQMYYQDNTLTDYFDTLDGINTVSGEDKNRLSGKININTAPKAVLLCLPSMTDTVAEAILSYRKHSPFTAIGHIISALKSSGISDTEIDTLLENIMDYITIKSHTFFVIVQSTVNGIQHYTIKALVEKQGTAATLLYAVYLD